MAKPRNDREIQVPDNPPAEVSQVAEAGSGRTAVRLELRNQGRDLLLMITGGEAHVGAVAVACADGTELVVVPGHKEGPLASECAEVVARASGRTCAAVAGIHQDHATEKEIQSIVVNVQQALETIIRRAFPAAAEDRMNHEQP